MGKSLKQEIEPGAVCVLFHGSVHARLVRVTRKDDWQPDTWYTRPYLDQGFPEKSVRAGSLTLLVNEMEVLAWASR